MKYRWQQRFNGSDWHDVIGCPVKDELDAVLTEYNGVEITVNLGNDREIEFRKVLNI